MHVHVHVYLYVCLCGHVAHSVAMANCLQLRVEFRAYNQLHLAPEDVLQKYGQILQECGASGRVILGFICVQLMDPRELADRLQSPESLMDFGP